MTTIASFQDVTYTDSLHVLEIDAGDKNYTRRPKLRILNDWAAYAISGSSIFPRAVLHTVESDLKALVETIVEKGFANDSDISNMAKVLNDESHILLILADTRWIIQQNKLIYVPENADVVLGTGGSHHNTVRYLIGKEEPEVILSKLALLDDHTRGPWVRFKHSQLKSKVVE